ncbi:MAG TPA: STAS domain-containing protein [Candidatus Baltobacteraceae bacterium]|nr:STAS domain-containing protein [Candidatus Baltobacteraceae bacterium]
MEGLHQAAVTVSLKGEYDINSRNALRRLLASAEGADQAIIDLSAVTYAGTTLINALLNLRKRMRKQGREGAIRLVGSSANIRKVLTITRLDRVFEVA